MVPGFYYDLKITASYSIDRSTIHLLIVLSVTQNRKLKYLDITSVYTSENYENSNIFVCQMPCWNGKYLHPEILVRKLKLNSYESKSAANIYCSGLNKHFTAQDRYPIEAEPCLYIYESTSGRTYIAFTTDEFFISAKTNDDIDRIKRILQKTYVVKSLCLPA